MANEVETNEEKFVEACWAFKRRQRTKDPFEEFWLFGLTWNRAEVLSLQAHVEFQNQATRHLPKPRKVKAA